jgi:hypothetical protein
MENAKRIRINNSRSKQAIETDSARINIINAEIKVLYQHEGINFIEITGSK